MTNGYRLHADRHETEGTKVRLFANGGITELSTGDIASFEQDDTVAKVPEVTVVVVTIAPVAPKKDMYEQAAEKHGLPVALVKSIVKAESNFHANALSPKGAIGLMQLMPGTAKELGADPLVPEQNVDAGTKYLRTLLVKYEDKEDQVARAVAAYNAGPGAVDKYNGVPPYLETQGYVRRVLRDYLKSVN